MLALVCQYAHLKVDTLAHWQPVEITQCRSDGVVLAAWFKANNFAIQRYNTVFYLLNCVDLPEVKK